MISASIINHHSSTRLGSTVSFTEIARKSCELFRDDEAFSQRAFAVSAVKNLSRIARRYILRTSPVDPFAISKKPSKF